MDRDTWSSLAQAVWQHVEPYHAISYFAPEHRAACDQVGLRGGWMAYFASRSAPLGAASAPLVTALFYNFHPAMVARAIPDAWSFASPAAVLDARLQGTDRALTRLLGDLAGREDLRRLADLAIGVATAADPAGRPLFAANLALDHPQPAHLSLWHATTLLREHRGDGHVAVLAAADIDGCQAHVLQVAAGVVPRDRLQPNRGWSDDDWQAATDELVDRGWLTPDGRLTDTGAAVRADVAARTDWLASAPLRLAGQATVHELLDGMRPLLRRMDDTGPMPYPNPIGLAAPPRDA